MTPKEKAIELTKTTIAHINGWATSWAENKTILEVRMDKEVGRSWFKAIDINLCFVNEIINTVSWSLNYWQEVKQEIENLKN
jgi:hypothetical protein